MNFSREQLLRILVNCAETAEIIDLEDFNDNLVKVGTITYNKQKVIFFYDEKDDVLYANYHKIILKFGEECAKW